MLPGADFTATFIVRGVTRWLPMPPGLWLARQEFHQTARESERA
ncbi:MAG: hypothetical protein AB7I68_13940 [Porticoccaceae bacterium]